VISVIGMAKMGRHFILSKPPDWMLLCERCGGTVERHDLKHFCGKCRLNCGPCCLPLADPKNLASGRLNCRGCEVMSFTTGTKEVTRPLLRYHGGKWLLAQWIISHFPKHRVYVEPCGGAASVLMQKQRAYGEVYNDIDSELVNVFRVLRDRQSAADLERLLRLTPFSRDEFRLAYDPTECKVEQARRTIVRSFMGFGSAAVSKAHKTGFRSNANRSGTTLARDWQNYPNHIHAFVERLQGVLIENEQAENVIKRHDTPETLFYIDPPYPWSTRYQSAAWADCYRHEMKDDDHRNLATVLWRVKGAVIISGYPCELYDRELYPDWKRVKRKAYADGAAERTEVLWMNKRAEACLTQRSLWGGVEL
jgi:DNA adenine methylase